MISEDKKHEVYHQLLMRSRQNPIKAADLAKALGVSLRDINEAVHALRKKGVLIGASRQRPYGYYIPGSEEEAREYIRSYRAELLDMYGIYRIQEKAANEFLAQERVGDLFTVGQCGQMEMAVI